MSATCLKHVPDVTDSERIKPPCIIVTSEPINLPINLLSHPSFNRQPSGASSLPPAPCLFAAAWHRPLLRPDSCTFNEVSSASQPVHILAAATHVALQLAPLTTTLASAASIPLLPNLSTNNFLISRRPGPYQSSVDVLPRPLPVLRWTWVIVGISCFYFWCVSIPAPFLLFRICFPHFNLLTIPLAFPPARALALTSSNNNQSASSPSATLHRLPHKDAARETSYGSAFGASPRVRAFHLRAPFRAPPSLISLPDLTVSSTIPPRLSKLPHAVHYRFKMRAPPTANRSLSPTRIIGRRSKRTLRRTPYIQPCPQLTEPAFPIPTSPSLPRHAPRPPTTPPINAHILDSP
ncbi:hypothetical protein B0H13DRAFT_2527898 [Mycena leptocephala]|nr:hypothetical protein B0H13DRAFT_2527898 [Mycena leptocephala]